MTRDFADLPLSNADDYSAASYNNYVAEFLSYGSKLRALFEAADRAPHTPLLNAHAAALHLAFEGAEGWKSAAPYLASMHAASDLNGREQLFCEAVSHWANKDFRAALSTLDELTVRWPADLCAIKWGQYHAFNLGDAQALLRFGERARIVHEGKPYAHGLIAFALEQNHDMRGAEEEGMRAVDIAADDAWAHHAVAHVMETEHRAQDGAKWLAKCAPYWEDKGVFIRDHNWWHAALFQLALGHERAVLDIFDHRLWGNWTEFPQEMIGAISMLWRLELRGIDTANRWAPVIDEVRNRAGEQIFAFHDLHYVYALARAGEKGEAEDMVARIREKGAREQERGNEVWAQNCLPVAEALVDFCRGNTDPAAQKLDAALDHLHLVGGSHAQRHIFVETLDACARGVRIAV